MAFVNLLEIVYPVGSFYISRINTSPSSIIGGTWTKLTNAALRAGTSVGYTGNDTHSITIDEMPNHRHDLNDYVTNSSSNPADYNLKWGHNNTPTGAVYTSYAGGGQAMSLVQRSYNCYMWYRTA